MSEKKYCKDCNKNVKHEEFHHQGNRCKKCRSQKSKNRIDALTGIQYAKHLLHQSCIRALERCRRNEKKHYRGVEIDWEKPLDMKNALMEKEDFWYEWLRLTEVYEISGRKDTLRPTLDRIEADIEKGGHYMLSNIQALPHGENTVKGVGTKCKVMFIKNLRPFRVADYESMEAVMKELGISGRNVLNVIKNSGRMHEIDSAYSVFVQTIDGQLKVQDTPSYKAVITMKKFLVDNVTGKEYLIGIRQNSFYTYGIWFNESQMMPE
ncbi:hypothetical protein [Priestia taiwanensis]|uniref:Uncharacterized protein n=1 Tax=Priestia taiwanensis TaxID=1347902 RepID=A0A917ER90_9BACI|nr:hypothetical protein [Priestia taiwanensis]MBM7363554.1 hypothetical protein [Priestia taiwanensis]GGE76157.1 hypothetical protein GCM10007140_27370 [Priestia taiwanensis]